MDNSVVIGNESGNTQKMKTNGFRLVLVPCVRVLMVRVRVQVRVPSTTTLVVTIVNLLAYDKPDTSTVRHETPGRFRYAHRKLLGRPNYNDKADRA